MENVEFTTYSPLTGEFLSNYSVPADSMNAYANMHFVTGTHDPETTYLDERNKKVKTRPVMNVKPANDIEAKVNQTFSITGIPRGALCSIAGDEFTMDGSGVLEYSSTVPLEDFLTIRCFPYRPVDIKVVITA